MAKSRDYLSIVYKNTYICIFVISMRVNVILFLPFTDMILSVDSTKRPFSSAESVICVTPRLFVQDLEFKV
jgi:hypothetical protein